jgi:hypothetical protein
MDEIIMIYRSPDGICVIKGMQSVENELTFLQKEWGSFKFGADLDSGEILIIRGKICIPKPISVTTQWVCE